MAPPSVAASTESQYVSDLVGYLNDAAEYLTQARVALNSCLSNQTACATDSQPYRDQIEASRLGVDDVRHSVGLLLPPPKYAGVQAMAVESLANISTALVLLNTGLESFDSAALESAGTHLDSARLQIQTIYDQISAMPPSDDSTPITILWTVVAGLAVLVSVNLVFAIRATRRDTRVRKREASKCPRCGAVMMDFDRYPLKTVEAWMKTHKSTYHPREVRPSR